MIPDSLIQIEYIPQTATGKINRLKLSEVKQIKRAEVLVKPRDMVEESIYNIWVEALNIELFGIDSNFFELGGQSLKALRIAARINDVFKIQINQKHLFMYPTIRDLASKIQHEITNSEYKSNPKVVKVNRDQSYELTPQQRGLWLIENMDEYKCAYNQLIIYKTKNKLDINLLNQAINQIIERHDVFNLTIDWDSSGNLCQTIRKIIPNNICTIVNKPIRELIGEELSTPFNFGKPPYLRCFLDEVNSEENYLLITFHHIISDGWSNELFINELEYLYGAYMNKTECALKLPRYDYLDYANWGNIWYKEESFDNQLLFWEDYLKGIKPIDWPKDILNEIGIESSVFLTLPQNLLSDVANLSKKNFTTKFTVLLAAYYIVLSYFVKEVDVVVGTPVANRLYPEFEKIMGYFANVIPIRYVVLPGKTFSEMISSLHENIMLCIEHQHVPFEIIEKRFREYNHSSIHPIFQTMFVISENTYDFQLGGNKLERVYYDSQVSKFDLLFEVIVDKEQLLLKLEYNRKIFSAFTAKAFLELYHEILNTCISSADKSINPIIKEVSANNFSDFYRVFNKAELSYNSKLTLPQHANFFYDTELPALLDCTAKKTVNYKQLIQQADCISERLRNSDIGKGDIVALICDRGPFMAIAFLGIIRIGATYLPINPIYPLDRIEYILNDSASKVVLSDSKHLAIIKSIGYTSIQLEKINYNEYDENKSTQVDISMDDPAYIIYTSGTTGNPKGVVQTHRTLVNLTNWQIKQLGNISELHVAQFSSFGFDVSLQEICFSLFTKSFLCFIGENEKRDPQAIVKFINDNNINVLFMPTASLYNLSSLCELKNIKMDSLKAIIVAGEALRLDTHEKKLFKHLKDCMLINQYGPSETHVVASEVLPIETDDWPEISDIGTPIDNTQIYVLDEYLNLVPPGFQGEICIAGDNLAIEYLNKEELTHEKFQQIEISNLTIRVYKSGDIGRINEFNKLEFHGRKDKQIKLRGFRIEPKEIEVVLCENESIIDSVVVCKDISGQKKLIAYYVIESGAAIQSTTLETLLKDKLPAYMIPSVFINIPSIPLTYNGKVDETQLSLPSEGDYHLRTSYIGPKNDIEQWLCESWGNILKTQKIGVYDNFFELGGHSLLLSKSQVEITKQYGVNISLTELYQKPQIYIIARLIKKKLIFTKKGEILEYVKNATHWKYDYWPITKQQEQIWLIDKLSGSESYSISYAIKITGEINISALQKAIYNLCNRQELLRAKIIERDDTPYFTLNDIKNQNLHLLFANNDDLHKTLKELVNIPFELELGNLCKFYLVNVQDNARIFLIVLHHIIADGWSLDVLIKELTAIYNDYVNPKKNRLKDLPIQFKDYSLWLHDELLKNNMKDIKYWSTRLEGANYDISIPTDFYRSSEPIYDGEEICYNLSPSICQDIEKFSKSNKGTVLTVFLSCLNILISYYNQQKDVIVGTAISNRPFSEVQGLIGYFAQTLILRNYVSSDISFSEFYSQVKDNFIADMAHSNFTPLDIMKHLKIKRDFSRNPFFEIMLVMQDEIEFVESFFETAFESYQISNDYSSFDMSIFITKSDSGYQLRVKYKTSLFRASTIKRLMKNFEEVLTTTTTNPEIIIKDICPLSQEERRELLVNFNDTDENYQLETCVHNVFENQVSRTPHNVAISYNNNKLLYCELNNKANLLAKYIIENKVKKEEFIAIFLERSPEYIISMLGIMKAGAAYIPLDSTNPYERVRHILDDSSARFIITEKSTRQKLPNCNIPIIDINKILESEETVGNPCLDINNRNLAYMIYTSGTTGKPKGTMIEHKSLMNYLYWAINFYDLTSNKGVPLISSPAFDISVTSIYPCLLSGGYIHIIDKGEEINKYSEFLSIPQNYNLVKITPAHFYVISDLIESNAASNWSSCFVIGGEQLIYESLRFWQTNAPETKLINEYGPTEATVGCCVYDASKDLKTIGSVPIGTPIANTKLYVLNETLNLVPIGVPGELYIGGICLSRGYYNREDLNRHKFIDNPFIPKEKLYKTGDLVIWRENGTLEFINRLDDQIKIRGYRIEVGEIEHALLEYDGIKKCAIVKQLTTNGNEILVAYLVNNLARNPAEIEIRQYLQSFVPDYMIPTIFMFVDDIPISDAGKVDKKALPKPLDLAITVSEEYVSPADPTELTIAKIWQDILGLSIIGVNEDFFEIGGHSLLAVKMLSQLNNVFKLKIAPHVLYRSSTIKKLAAAIFEDLGYHEESALVNIQPLGDKIPIYFIHPAGGHAFCFIPLAREMGTERPFFAVQNIFLHKPYKVEFTLDELSDIYIEEIKRNQPNGPYIIGGWSFGGVVAFDICQKLLAQGDCIEILIMLDSYLPSSGKIKQLMSDDDLVSLAIKNGQILTNTKDIHVDIMSNIYLQSIHTLFTYQAKPYNGEVLLIEASEMDESYDVTAKDTWSEILKGNIRIVKSPGNHHSMVKEPNVKILADIIMKILKR
jgi:amino acid adenylation domain-containing protein